MKAKRKTNGDKRVPDFVARAERAFGRAGRAVAARRLIARKQRAESRRSFARSLFSTMEVQSQKRSVIVSFDP